MYNRQGQTYTPAGRSASSSYNFQHQPGTPAIRRQGSANHPIGSAPSSRAVYGGQPYGMQRQQQPCQPKPNWAQSQSQQQLNHHQQRNYSNHQNFQGGGVMPRTTRSTPQAMLQQHQGMIQAQAPQQGGMQMQGMQVPAGMKTYATTAGIPPEVEGNPSNHPLDSARAISRFLIRGM